MADRNFDAWRGRFAAAPTLDAAWRQRVAEGGTALLADGAGGADTDAAALERAVAACAGWLHHAGTPVRAGDRVLLMLDNGLHFLAAFLGCQRLGAIPVPLSPRSGPERVAALLRDCGACCVLTGPDLSARQHAAHAAQPYAAQLRRLPERLDTLAAQPVPAPATSARDCAFIQYTSGSTGDAKGVMVSHQAALCNVQAFCATLQVGPDDRFSSMLPLYHDMGLVCFGLAPLLLGCPLVLHRAEALSLRAWLQGVARHGVTLTGAPDTLLQLALRILPEGEGPDLQSLRVLICGSEPVRADTVAAFAARWQLAGRIKPAYGMAELTLCATLTPPHAHPVVDADGHVSCGVAIGGVRLRIDTDAPGAGAGHILVHSPAAMLGYWGRPEASAAAFDADGFVRTGDWGYLDAQGRLFVLGRDKNLLVRGGEKYSPHDLESAAMAQAAVRRAAVIQTQDRAATIVCVLEAERRVLQDAAQMQATAQAVRRAAHARAGLMPDICAFVAAGSLPVTDNGKLQHARLRTLWQQRALPAIWSDAQESADVAVVA